MKKILFILLVVLMLPVTFVSAQEASESAIAETEEITSLYNYINNMSLEEEMLNSLDIKEYIEFYLKNGTGNITFGNILKIISSLAVRELISFIKLAVMIMIVAVVAALVKNLQSAFSNGSISNVAYYACYALLVIILSKSFIISVDIAKETISRMSNFMLALVPVLLALLATVGGVVQAATMDPIIITVINLCPKIYRDIIIPLILASFALQFANNISEERKISGLCKLMRQGVIWMQGFMITLVIGILTVRSAATNTLDAVTLKTAKFAVDNFIPIVGKAMSDAISTVAGYSLILKNAIGALGLVITILIVITPIIKIFLCAMVYKLTAAFIEPISDSRIVSCIATAGDSLILIMSTVISISVMFFIMISIIASAGKFVISG